MLHVESVLTEQGVQAGALQAARAAIDTDLEDAIGWAQAEQVLDEGDLAAFVYTGSAHAYPAPAASERALDFYGAVSEALRLEMEADESVIVLGEDVGRLGGIFHATQGLWEQFGEAARAQHADFRGRVHRPRRRCGARAACAPSSSCRSSTS